ncbi:conserved hypothetical protein [Cupriavidus taiwanensis]|uniref:Replication protein O n=1 Tax=Cupriavidus taiwanensis TaxID=164546 RepID=A0A375CR78_9BURK|nr:hypothetical protein [Cupriavidus taiwanensis]SOY77658.1 conserved hypothetical protein [Cupriavidus taiwanensis]
MSIAQHFVAGEGFLQPAPHESGTTLPADAVNLPWVILRAVHHASRLEGIPARARAVLAALARTVDAAKPCGQIFARRSLLTERAMQSERTFYRSLDDLEAAGLIERPGQRRYVEAGLFGRAYLHLTERAAILLGLVEAPVVPREQPAKAAEEPAAKAFTQPSATVADGGIYKDLSPSFIQKRQPGQVPQDLQRLQPLGFRDFLIFKLMREAREHGKRLSDVVEATWEHLRQAARPISYLRSLLRSSTDFGFQVRNRVAQREAERLAQLEQAEAKALVKTVSGQTFVDAGGAYQVVVETDGVTLTVYQADEGVPRRDVGNWQVNFARALRSGRLRRLTQKPVPSTATYSRPADVPRSLTASVAGHLMALRGMVRRA